MVCCLLLLAGSGWVDDGVEVHLGRHGCYGRWTNPAMGLCCCCGSKGLGHEVGGGKELLSPDSGAGWRRSSGQRKEEARGWP